MFIKSGEIDIIVKYDRQLEVYTAHSVNFGFEVSAKKFSELMKKVEHTIREEKKMYDKLTIDDFDGAGTLYKTNYDKFTLK